MKKLRIPLKVAVILLFVVNTGIFKQIARVASEDSKLRNDPASNAKVVNLCEERYLAATAKVERGEAYSPYDYFRDLGDIYAMEDSLKVSVGLFARHGVGDLQALSMKFLDSKQFTLADVDKARSTFQTRGDIARNRMVRDAEATTWSAVWSESLCPWIVRNYLEGIPLACILLLIWIGEGSERKKKFFLRSPISFLFSLACYPLVFVLVFARWMKNLGRSVYAEVELRRTKDAFLAILSRDELDAIKRFAESRFAHNVWRERLQSRGLVTRRSFALGFASFVICFVVLGPHQAFAKTIEVIAPHVVVIIDGSSGGIDCSTGCGDISPGDHSAILHHGVILEMQSVFHSYWSRAFAVCKGWMKDVEHIPVSWLTRFEVLTNVLTTYKKETKNESILFDIHYGAFLRHHVVCTATR